MKVDMKNIVWEKASATSVERQADELVCEDYSKRMEQNISEKPAQHASASYIKSSRRLRVRDRYNQKDMVEFCMKELGYIKVELPK